MAEVESDCFPSKRIRLSPERENNILNTSIEQVNRKHEPIIDEEPFLSTSSAFQTSNDTSSLSREQDGGGDDFLKHDQFEGDDFPTCFSVEDDITNREEHHYQPIAGPMGWVQRQMNLGIDPREILSYMVPHAKLPSDLEDDHITLWKVIIDLLTSPTPHQKLDHINTIDDVVSLINGCKNIVVLTGAGVSVSCGIPDFRSRDGIYARLSEEYPDLPDPQAMFDITYFNQNPYPFFKFAKEIYPGQFKPSLSHRFIHQIEKHGSLLCNYSQNIDTLEQIAGITKIIQCHGSFSTASCTKCKFQVSSSDIKEDIFNQRIPLCSSCNQEDGKAIMKPDIVFFGENLPSDFYHHLEDDSEKADLLIVIGSSLKVRPVALIPSRIAEDVPQILINREPLRHMTFDVELLGDCDIIVAELCRRLGGTWADTLEGSQVCPVDKSLYPLPTVDTPIQSATPIASNSSGSITVEAKNSGECLAKECPTEELTEKSAVTCTTPSSPSLEQKQDTEENYLLEESSSGHTSKTGLDPSNTSSEQSVTIPASGAEKFVVQELSACVQSVGQNTSYTSTDDNQRQGTMTPSESPLATEYPSNQISISGCTNEDPPIFLYHPPSRYIFYGAEITNSPIHSPFGSPVPTDDDGNSDGCSENDSLSRDGFDCNLERNGYSSGDGSEGYGSGVMSSTDCSSYDLKLITGALGDYHCVSEENSIMSAIDLAGEGNGDHTNDDLLNVSNVLSRNDVPQSTSSELLDNSSKGLDNRGGVELSLSHAGYSSSTQESFVSDSTLTGQLDST